MMREKLFCTYCDRIRPF